MTDLDSAASHTVGPLSEHARLILAEATEADGTPPMSDQAVLAVAQGRRSLIETDDALGVIGEGELDLAVRPTARGRGLGRAMLVQLLDADTSSGELRAWAHGENPAANKLLSEAKFEPVRELLRLTLDPEALPNAISSARAMPPGFEVRGYDPNDPQQAVDWVRVNAAAFASHPEQGSVTVADFLTLTQEPWFSDEDLRLAYTNDPGQDSQLAGFTWVKTVRGSQEVETELYVLGVDPAFAGIGLGAALLGETLRQMASHSPNRITLYVDGDNTNAVELYLRAGFAVEQRSVQYLRG
ncbi:mycothiol synthase [Leucobacter sp. UT-8R-CII-1-4]|uniref:mycothiol synthase n=1 Tax=Leucobacter sp. UT-8R-CII-1-4 TaxID=3040075 RepID=UPI0024A889EA|nr:mycothiol synthase [Leucobacter sp. UT-8R-CII-1-4]MDI6023910.1 mycothiol synthase [Leucobacter sp. UT-8R-CII-1-4]